MQSIHTYIRSDNADGQDRQAGRQAPCFKMRVRSSWHLFATTKRWQCRATTAPPSSRALRRDDAPLEDDKDGADDSLFDRAFDAEDAEAGDDFLLDPGGGGAGAGDGAGAGPPAGLGETASMAIPLDDDADESQVTHGTSDTQRSEWF